MAGWSTLDGRERPVLEWLAGLRGTAFDDVMRDVSTGPPRVAAWLIAAALVCAGLRSARPLIAVLCALLLAQILSSPLKDLAGRPRPPATFPDIHAMVALPADGSFPSGHAMLAAAAAGALWWSSRRAALALGAFALLIGLSRVWLCVHYPSDVLAGLVLGAAIGLLCGLASRTGSGPARVRRSRSPPPPPP
jgi:undecaprenyl-diphosphatase